MWDNPPEYYDVTSNFRNLGICKGKIVLLEREIQKADDALTEKYPRKPGKRREELSSLYDALAKLQAEKEELEYAVKIDNYHKDMYEVKSRKVNQPAI